MTNEDRVVEPYDSYEEEDFCPYEPPQLPIQWQRQFAQIRLAKCHERALNTLLTLRGGIAKVKVRAVAKALSHHEIFSAALDLRKPVWPLYESEELRSIVDDPLINVLTVPLDQNKGRNIPSLIQYGVSAEAVEILLEMQSISVVIEAHLQGTLMNVDMMAIEHKRNMAHHRLLSLPSGSELVGATDIARSVYECCRLSALTYDLTMLFAVLPFTGIKRLVVQVRRAAEFLDSQFWLGPNTKIFTWVFFIAGAAIPSESAWFVEQLRTLLAAQCITTWIDAKAILASFLWMSEGMDSAAIELWGQVVDSESSS
jgi:VIT1/CCC1 family predicted Fe2+/Mn2+ transporter